MHQLGIRRKRSRLAALVAVLLAAMLAVAGCTIGGAETAGEASPAEKAPVAQVVATPVVGARDVSPIAPVSVTVTGGTLDEVALNNSAGTPVAGQLSADRTSYVVSEPLGYAATYSWSGSATGTDGKTVSVEGSFTTLTPESQTGGTLNIADGQEVGIAAPITLQFDSSVVDKAAVEKALVVTSVPPTAGSWAWLPDDNGGSRAHWRPAEYWVPGTVVHLDAKLYGLNYGGGAYGDQDLTLDFTIGRSQIVKANAPSHRMQVVRDGQTIMDIPVSYGEGNEARNVTRSGIHMVTEKYEDFLMSNPPFYENVRERWAVRISNNGEFIHANPETTGVQGSSNVTNGCINLSMSDAQEYFGTALYGDPVEVTGTSIDLSAADGDIYDWAIDLPTWKSMSALA
ncbi:L,D-transpeptidase family protein [Rhodococcus sp. KBS0724]|uniref:L,D-transpeptidase n=1 Tax=Rhodococcus sp. KBS0724 TaxID=1179674 RepID=UPI00110D6E19|nr:Ig-like domain-containing protein [Rhodococcus sp. KBS0724]TSD48673.1 L,D-transpeptidase family protein [Rhodococcus sp. KBS0724]